VSPVDANTVSIYVNDNVPDDDIDELVQLLDEAGLDAVVGPNPGRMGLLSDLPALIVEAPLGVLASLAVTATGQRVWRVLNRIANRGRRQPEATDEAGQVAVTLHDTQNRVRLDLTLDDLADSRVQKQLAQLGTFSGNSAQIVLRWDGVSGAWRVHDSDAS
jgi:hypothetical protein